MGDRCSTVGKLVSGWPATRWVGESEERIGMLLLQGLELVEEAIVLFVRNVRSIFYIVEIVVVADRPLELLDSLRRPLALHRRPPGGLPDERIAAKPKI
jgi:hypothetical protein